jgi:hypothetical protein
VGKGWNYVAFNMDEIYDYSYLTIYLRTELHSGAKLFDKYESFSKGVRNFGLDDTVILGCKTLLGMGDTSAPTTWASTPSPADVQYGLCMKGWINTIEFYRGNPYNVKWDLLFNADVDTQNDLDNFIKS